MATCKQVIKKAKEMGYSGNDIYIPRATTYPHVHVNKDHVTYSTTRTSHKPLINGDTELSNNVKGLVVPKEATYNDVRTIIDFINKN